MKQIESFSGEYRFLSNFWPCEIEFQGLKFRSVEAAYVASKSLDPEIWKYVSELPTSGKAKSFGRTIELRPDWLKVKVNFMRNFLVQKFKNPELMACLDATSPMHIIEGNSWGDVFWGECPIGTGKNTLGKLLMEIRDDITRFN